MKNICLIGAGEFGNFASKVMNLLPQFRIYAVVDTDKEARKKLAHQFKAKEFSNYETALKDPLIDIVMINTPNYLHAKMTIDSIKAGKRVLCEKPIGINEREVKRVGDALRKYQGRLLVNFLLPQSELYKKLGRIIKNNVYGEVRSIKIQNLATEATIKTPWYWNKRQSGGWFLTADIHFYHLIRCLSDDKIKFLKSVEYLYRKKTAAIWTELQLNHAPVEIYHDFAKSFQDVDFTASFKFEKAEAIIKGWIPTSLSIKQKEGSQIFKIEEDRNLIYQRLIAQNLAFLEYLTAEKSLSYFQEVLEASEIAFEAENNARKKIYGKNKS